MDIRGKIKDLPQLPGVYIFKDKKGKALYIGKAGSLRKRVSAHFQKNSSLLNRGFSLEEIADIDFVVCDSEAKALILENTLIKERKPKYNILLRDDKSFPWVEISKEAFPKVSMTRKKKEGFIYFGPYPQAKLLKKALEVIRKIFPFRTCSKLPKKECLYYHLGLCPGPCIGKISKRDYLKNIKMLSLILEGRRKRLIELLSRDMEKAVSSLEFEKASLIRNKLFALSSLYGTTKEFQQLISLKEVLGLKKLPRRIEALDISNIRKEAATGSVVVFEDGLPLKSEYRRYKIKRKVDSDLGRMAEVVERRIRNILQRKKFPDLVIVDGGIAQVNLCSDKFKKAKLSNIPVIGISKKNEEIWFAYQKKPLRLERTSLALTLIQRLRDEAHRFAHQYYSYLRKKALSQNRTNK
ncbi:MAG: excinuclease ABC subunit UvrC [Candidatus Omnitrophota bacterium]|nr:MAG: excinuclease ABC subunit UvrC [Candidatus Omnitrophota bacterium]